MDELTEPNEDITVDATIEAEGISVISVAGEIDASTVEQIRSAVAQAATLNAKGIIFDLSGVEFMDSSGIAALIEARVAAASIALRKPSQAVQRLLIATGLTDTLPVEP
jgi:anti-sigma B factor antagonist